MSNTFLEIEHIQYHVEHYPTRRRNSARFLKRYDLKDSVDPSVHRRRLTSLLQYKRFDFLK